MGGMQWNRPLYMVLMVFFFLAIFMTLRSRVSLSNSPDIDNFILGLNYSSDKVLAYTGEKIDSVVLNEGKFEQARNFIVITREKKNLQNNNSDIGVVASNEHTCYPGNILLANSHLIDNSPDVLAVQRAPLTYTVNLPGLTGGDASFTMAPSFSEYQNSVNKVLKTWFEKYTQDHNVVANFQSDHTFAYSQDLLSVKFGLEFKTINIEASSMLEKESLIKIFRLKQVFYTVSVEPTKKPSDLFGPRVTVSDLQQKTNDNNPPALVDSVSYGRTIYVKIETSSTDKEAKAILDTKIANFNMSAHAETEYMNKLTDLSMQVYGIGGSIGHMELITANTFTEIAEVIKRWSKFDRNNLGYPISYSTQFVKDNTRAVVNMATDYVEITRTVHKKGCLRVVHKGWFVTQWKITWQEFNYDGNGNKVETQKSWWRNWQDLDAPFDEEIELPGNAEQISVYARYCTGIAWDWWRALIDSSAIPLVERREFHVWGTTFSPQHEINPRP